MELKVITTVYIDYDKKKFLKENNIKLSEIANKAIDKLMKKRDNEDKRSRGSSK